MTKKYVPPQQSGFGQFVDSIFLLVVLYISLMAPLLMKAAKAPEATPAAQAATQEAPPQVTWESLAQNPTMQAQWEKLGFDAAKAQPLIEAKPDYVIEPVSLILTIAIIVGYFVFLIRISDKQYREVIAEKFGSTGR